MQPEQKKVLTPRQRYCFCVKLYLKLLLRSFKRLVFVNAVTLVLLVFIIYVSFRFRAEREKALAETDMNTLNTQKSVSDFELRKDFVENPLVRAVHFADLEDPESGEVFRVQSEFDEQKQNRRVFVRSVGVSADLVSLAQENPPKSVFDFVYASRHSFSSTGLAEVFYQNSFTAVTDATFFYRGVPNTFTYVPDLASLMRFNAGLSLFAQQFWSGFDYLKPDKEPFSRVEGHVFRTYFLGSASLRTFEIVATFVVYFVLALVWLVFSSSLGVYSQFLATRSLQFFDTLGVGRAVQFLSFLTLSVLYGAPLLLLAYAALFNVVSVYPAYNSVFLALALLALAYYGFFVDLLIVALLDAPNFVWRNTLFALPTFVLLFESGWFEFDNYFLNCVKGLNPLLSFLYVHRRITGDLVQRGYTSLLEVGLFERVGNYSIGAALVGMTVGLVFLLYFSFFVFLRADNFSFNTVNPILLIWRVCKLLRKRTKPAKDVHAEEKEQRHAGEFCVQGVTKKYRSLSGTFVAVDAVSFVAKPGEKIAILGANGAGKTTLLSVMTGVQSPSSGCVFFGSRRVRSSSDLAGLLGYCPQFTAALPDFSVEENLNLMLAFHALEETEKKRNKEVLLEALELRDRRNERPAALSGGQCRKLDFAMAVVAKPAVVVLDEPSTGVDVLGRKKMLALLTKDFCKDAIVFLSTHIVEEAERFADKLLLVSKGQKRVFAGLGDIRREFGLDSYRLTVNFARAEVDRKALLNEFGSFFTEATLIRQKKTRAVYSVRFASYEKLAAFYDFLDTHKNRLAVESFAVDRATLEEVLGLEQFREVTGQDAGDTESLQKSVVVRPSLLKLVVCQLAALKYKRLTDFFSSCALCFTLLLLLFAVLVVGVLQSKQDISNYESYALDLAKAVLFPDEKHILLLRMAPSLQKAFASFLLDQPDFVAHFSLVLPTSYKDFEDKLLTTKPSLVVREHQLEATPATAEEQDQLFFKRDYFDSETVTVATASSKVWLDFAAAEGKERLLTYLFLYWKTFFDPYVAKDPAFWTDSQKTFVFASAETRVLYQKAVEKFKVQLLAQPYPHSAAAMLGGSEKLSSWTALAKVVEKIVLATVAMFVVANAVRIYLDADFFSLSRKLQLAYGLPRLGSLFFDTLFDALVLFVVHVAVVLVFCAAGELGKKAAFMLRFCSVLAPSIFATVAFLYALARVFPNANNYKVAVAVVVLYNPLLRFVKLQAFNLVQLPGALRLANPLYAYYVLLCFLFQSRALYTFLFIFHEEFLFRIDVPSDFFFWQLSGDLDFASFHRIPLRHSVAVILLSFSVLFFFEAKLGLRLKRLLFRHRNRQLLVEKRETVATRAVDLSVAQEAVRVDQKLETLNKDDNGVVFDKVSVCYNSLFPPRSTLALADFALTTEEGEAVGLLGANGGGKSTAFKALLGEVLPEEGALWVRGTNVFASRALALVNYTPQSESLSAAHCAKAIFTFYAMLQGCFLWSAHRKAKAMVRAVRLGKNGGKAVQKLSGGNRRKIAIGLALLDSSGVLLLDEPTTGVDITNCREVWDFINSLAERRSLLLASHSMQETEELCTKIAVLVKGSTRCLGSPEVLKERFGNSFAISLEKESGFDIDRATDFLRTKFVGVTVDVDSLNLVRFYVSKQNFAIGDLVRFLAFHRTDLCCKDFLINQMSLENVLEKQIEEDEQEQK